MPFTWQARIEHARQVAEDARARRDADPVVILHWRPLRPYTPMLRLAVLAQPRPIDA